MIQESQLLSIIDHTLLKAEASREDIIRLCQEAIHYGAATVFTHGYYTPLVAEQLAGSRVRVGATAGFPYGAQPPAVKAFEARTSIADGAQEIDIVLNIGAMKSGEFDVVYRYVVNGASITKSRQTPKKQQDKYLAHKAFVAYADARGIRLDARFRRITRRSFGRWGLTWLKIKECGDRQTFRLFDLIPVWRRRAADK